MSQGTEKRKIFIKAAASVVVLVTTALAAGWMASFHLKEEEKPKIDEGVKFSAFTHAMSARGARLDGKYVFTDQDGNRFDLSSWFDKPLIISYIFTQCPQICPTITASLAKVSAERKDGLGSEYRIVSVGFDPKGDTTEAMRKFGSEFVDNFDNWKFVHGDQEIVRALADKLGIIYKQDENGSWQHTVAVTLVAPGGMVYEQVFGVDYSESQIFVPLEQSLNRRLP